MVRRRKLDIMTLLVIAVALGVITTTTVQANETDELNRIIGLQSCFTLPISACVTLNTMIKSNSNSAISSSEYISGYDWNEPMKSQAEQLASASFITIKEGRCAYTASFNGQQVTSSEEITEMRFDLNNHLGLDVGMRGDFIDASVSSVYLGFKDCW